MRVIFVPVVDRPECVSKNRVSGKVGEVHIESEYQFATDTLSRPERPLTELNRV